MSIQDYRLSHIAKGRGYQQRFEESALRRFVWSMEQRFLEETLRRCFVGRSVRYLDFACGTGRILTFLESSVADSVGVDVSPSMLDVCRSRVRRSMVLQADLTREDALEGQRFDLITAFRFFPNAQPELRDKAMAALVRHLTQDGRIVFNNHRNLSSLRYRLARLRRRGGREGMHTRDVWKLLDRHGVEIECSYHVGLLLAGKLRLPGSVQEILERAFSRIPILRSLAENQIYVCKRGN